MIFLVEVLQETKRELKKASQLAVVDNPFEQFVKILVLENVSLQLSETMIGKAHSKKDN